MAKVIVVLVFAWLANHVVFVLFGYPVVFCGAALLLSPFFPVIAFLKMVAATGSIVLAFLGRWGIAAAFALVAFAMEMGGWIFSGLFLGRFC